MIPSALKNLKGLNVDEVVSTLDNLTGIKDVAPQRMAGQAFSGLTKGQGLTAALGLIEKGLKYSGTPYGNKVIEAREGFDNVKDYTTDFGLSKLGL
jgi:hypothetical protein